MSAIHVRIDQLDVSLFQTIEGQSTPDDRRSFLALQSACRQWKTAPFTVLEVGSYLGGSLQGYVADPACARIISIDPRPAVVRDQRGLTWDYSHVSAEGMLTGLARVPGADIAKVHAITGSTTTIRVDELGARPDYCFIDGEHTDEAMLRDARFCLAAAGADCALGFHDAHIVYKGLVEFLAELEARGLEFRAYNLPGTVFVIELGTCRLSDFEPLRSWRGENYKGYLGSLVNNDNFREIARSHERLTRHPVVSLLRRLGLLAAAKKALGPRP